MRIANILLAVLILSCVTSASVVALPEKPIVEFPCVLMVSSGAEVLTSARKVFVAHSEFGDPLRNCVGLTVNRGTATVITVADDGSRKSVEVRSKTTVTEAMLQRPAQGQGFAKNLQVFWSIVTGSSGEALGYSRGSETTAAALTGYLSGNVLFSPLGSSIDLSAITDGKVESFAVTTSNTRRAVIAGVTFSSGVLRLEPGSLEADRSYRWIASVEGEQIVGELRVLSLRETELANESTSPRALGFALKTPQYLMQRAIKLSEMGLKVDSLMSAQEWIRSH